MGLFLRITSLILIVSCLLVVTSSAVGYLSDAIIVRVKIKVGAFTYLMHVEDQTYHILLMLAGTRCYPALPDWSQPESSPLPFHDYAHVFIDRGDSVFREWVRCAPL